MKLLLAPAGHGKTAHIIQRVRVARAVGLQDAIWVILPNQEQVQVFRQRLALAGGGLGVDIDTFYAFFARVLELAGRPIPRLADPVQHRLLRGVIDALAEEGALRHYAPLRHKPGFLRRLRDLIVELKQARIDPEAFTAATAAAPPRLAELAAIYRRYQGWLQDADWADAEGQGWLAALALENNSKLCTNLRLLAVDGFDEFNPTQLAVLRLLAQRADEAIVTLTGESDGPDRDAHRRFSRARAGLCTACAPVTLHSLPAFPPEPSANHAFEAALFTPHPSPPPPGDFLTLIEARNRSEEARAALRWLKALIVREGVAPHECAILARTLDPYRPHLAEIAGEFGLPLYLSGGEDLHANPAMAALLSVLALPLRDWPSAGVLAAWRSPYFDWAGLLAAGGAAFPDMTTAASRLALVVAAARISGGAAQWREALTLRSHIAAAAESEEENQPAVAGPIAAEAAALLRMFDAFTAALRPPASATLAAHIAFVEDLIGLDPHLQKGGSGPAHDSAELQTPDLHVVARARANPAAGERDIAALQAFKDVLRGLLLAETITASLSPPPAPPPPPLPYARFFSELAAAVAAASYRLPRPRDGAILAAPVLQARGISFRAVALLGLSEGEFPQQEREDPLLWDEERVSLAARGASLPLRLRGDEISLFYQAATRARQRLLLTRPYLSEQGQAWEPSPYWQEVQRLTAASPQRQNADAQPASLPEYLAAVGGGVEVQRSAAILETRQARRAAGPHEGDLAHLTARVHSFFPPDHVWSSSGLESYAVCPFQFFVRTVLGLEPRPAPTEGFDVLILGSIYHAVLEEVYRRARDQGEWSEAALLALLPQVAGPLLEDAPRRYGFRPGPLWAYQRQEMLALLARNLAALSQAAGAYAPLALEAAFGLAARPPLDLSTAEQPLRLRGYIDRIDQAPDGRLRIIDYKSGSTPIRPNDLTEGKRIQLPLYALAATRALGLGEVHQGHYWHLGAAKPSSLTLETYGPEAMTTAVAHARSHVRGIRAARFQPHPPAEGCPASCPATAFCWRYRPQRT